jgi:hypothetical protein
MKKISMIAALGMLCVGSAFADSVKTYEITVTNVTKGQTFTPILAATHKSDISFFSLGSPATDEIATLAESGNPGPLTDLLVANPDLVGGTANTGGLLPDGLLTPGQSVTYEVTGEKQFRMLSMAAMLLPTNDSFLALNTVELPKNARDTRVYFANAYDAGSEANDELCANIPGPPCFGAALSDPADSDEGYVHLSPGTHGEADLASSMHDWRGAVAKITVRRVN